MSNSTMDVHLLAAETNELICHAKMDLAITRAAEFIKATLELHVRCSIEVIIAPKTLLGVVRERHVVLALENHQVTLGVPSEMVWGQFSNNFHSFQLVGALISTYSVSMIGNGLAVIDLEDASNDGEYDRASFSCPLPKSDLIVDTYYVAAKGYSALRSEIDAAWIPWLGREAKVFWRGGTGGLQSAIPPADDWHWRWLPRLNLCDVAARSHLADRLDIGIVNLHQILEESTREAIINSTFMRSTVERMTYLQYRYVVDIDGNGNAWNGFFGAMLMGSCIFKVASPHGWRQWYYDRLIPGVHYIPVRSDLSDFSDTVEWAFAHPRESEEIGRRARQFALAMNYEDEIDLSGAKLARLLLAGRDEYAVMKQLSMAKFANSTLSQAYRVQAQAVITALYESILERGVDEPGLAHFLARFKTAGTHAGIVEIANQLLSSDERKTIEQKKQSLSQIRLATYEDVTVAS